jgi:hypothetical protein
MAEANVEAFRSFLQTLAESLPGEIKHPKPPPPEPRPDFQVDLVRPDDLLALHVAGYNLKVVPGQASPSLARIDDAKDAHLAVTFPPQNILEGAYFNSAKPKELPPTTPPLPPDLQAPPDPTEDFPPKIDGTHALLSGFSRLVFRIPANEAMPAIAYSIEGLLDWSGLELAVAPLADLPPHPSLQEIAAAPAIAPPGPRETAIELPYRLILSPNRHVAWQHAAAPVTRASRTELWHTRLALRPRGGPASELSPANTAPLRAIWSPDHSAARAGDDLIFPTKTDPDPDFPGVTDISPNDRHQIVVLTSAFHGYYKYSGGRFVPSPVDAQMLILSPLGGWLRSRGHWEPPQALPSLPWFGQQFEAPKTGAVGAVAPEVIARADAPAAFEAPPIIRPAIPLLEQPAAGNGERLDLSEWVHVAAQGRDHYVRIVYEGHLYPFGHRAALIKVTERKFVDVAVPEGGTTPVAVLIQRQYIVVREPEKSYRGLFGDPVQDAKVGRKMPLTKVRLTTLITPDLAPPQKIGGTAFSFWIRVGASGQEFPFHAVATDAAGNEIEFTAALIFASLAEHPGEVAIGPPTGLAAVRQAYAGSGPLRACAVPKQKMTYADPLGPGSPTDNTTLATSALYFDTDPYADNTALLTGYGGYLPRLYKADVHIPAIEQLLGTDTATTIALYQPYIDGGFDPNAGVFAEIVKDTGKTLEADALPITFSADKAGGIATPNLNLSHLTRAHGPLAGKPEQAAQDTLEPTDFFGGLGPDDLPKLFGALPLSDLLAGATGPLSASNDAPKTQFSTADGGKTLVVTFHWKPSVGPCSVPLVTFTPRGTVLEIQGQIRKPVGTPPAGTGSFAFTGQLTDFDLEILNAIVLHFDRFAFSAGSNRKLDVTVGLNKANPFAFEGDLEFVQDLASIIPPGTFGDGPSIDLTPEPAVHVGYGITLPPAPVGVFSLENVKLSAGLTLPLLTGKPLVDFGFAERHHPFLLTVTFLGGGGFLHLQLDTNGMKMLEAALEFGANASINLGVASGGVHIMAGIYFSMQVKNGDTTATLSGYLRMGGELSVLGIISLSLEFILSFTYDTEKKASGQATLTVAVKVLCFSKSVEISVEKRFGSKGHDPTFADLIDTPAVWGRYADAFA